MAKAEYLRAIRAGRIRKKKQLSRSTVSPPLVRPGPAGQWPRTRTVGGITYK